MTQFGTFPRNCCGTRSDDASILPARCANSNESELVKTESALALSVLLMMSVVSFIILD